MHTPPRGPVDPAPTSAWEEAVRTALLGTDRRRAGPPTEPGALLTTAAELVLARRAGLRPGPAPAAPAPAPPDPRPEPPEAARRRLASLLAGRAAGPAARRAPGPDLTELLPQWLATAVAHGYRAPSALLPALLETARARTDLRAPALALAGPRGRWLAALNPEWRFVSRAPVPGAGLPDPADGPAVHRLWGEGLFAERVALLGLVRRRSPAAAVELLRATWDTERAEDRLLFLDALRTGLSLADEPFLEAALTDRSRNVRVTAAELLSALPGSALAARMAARATAHVGPGGTVPPAACDPGMEHDGVLPHPPSGRGARSWWLGQLVEAAPLDCWRERFDGAGPAEVLASATGDRWGPDLHAGWCRAAIRQRNAVWATALLGDPGAPVAAGPLTASPAERAGLLETLPEAERAVWVAGFVRAHGLPEAFQLLGTCAVPWAGSLGEAVLDALAAARDAGGYPWSFSGVMGLAERCLDPSAAPRPTPGPPPPEGARDATAGAGGDPARGSAPVDPTQADAYWAEAFDRLAATLRVRATMAAELEPPR
ncbi:DUF5691 domain-containing protein [Streptomyces sp. BI20]|uniref:DUF5691 domain-containing protein n=1 Tax=Streptomyces sp. BI20 TaxID=3403460 RepID=UPI003C77EA20